MKIGILTFHCAINYGAVLQAYGLQEFLRGLGHDVFVIDYRPKYLTKPYRAFNYLFYSYSTIGQYIKGFIRSCLIYPIRYKRNRNFFKFIKKYLKLCSLDLNKKKQDFDVFVFGSDQIWNPQITQGFDKIFFGDFPAAENSKLIAYAVSMGGQNNLSEMNSNLLLNLLNRFSYISEREHSLQDICNREMLDKEITTVVDPVLLSGRDIFEHIVIPIKEKFPYLLLFQLGKNEIVTQYAKKIAKQKKLNFIEIVSFTDSLKDKNLKQDLSPQEFLGYFKRASYIITTSYHGTVFSILFQKQFNTIAFNTLNDERALFLLKLLNLETRMNTLNTLYDDREIDYSLVEKKLQIYQRESRNYIMNALNG